MFAGILFGKNYFFHGKNFEEQLEKIVCVLGSDKFNAFIQKYDIKPPEFVSKFAVFKGKTWKECMDEKTNKKFIDEDSLDLLDKLLRYDPNERLTAMEAMQHKYFDKVRAAEIGSNS